MFEAINSSIFPGINYVSTIPRTCYFPKVDTYQEITDNPYHIRFWVIWTIRYEKTIILANKYAKKIIKNNLVAPINHIDLEFSSTIIKVPILAQYKAARILGVHFNPNDCHNTSTKKNFSMINYVTMLIRKKKLIHDHVIYMINKVIIPRIEYLSQHFMLSINQCNKINISLRSTIKQSVGLPKNIFNSVLHSNIYPNIVNFFDHQLKVQSSLLVTQANNPYTSNTLKFLFLLCQQKHWLPNSIINFFDLFDKPLKYFSRLESLLTFFKFYNLSLSSNFKFSMKGGTYPLSHFIIDKKFLFAHINSIRNKGIMFLYHIITKDYAFLEDYNDIKKHLVHKGGKIPHWYNFLKENITINNQGRLVFDLNRPIIQNPSAPRSAIPSEDPNTLHHPKRL
ncbi:hypothetical protein RhiirB3_451176 [Rhizophagus irregularis]|nr:hypothetical protein RhiirB3_451176 [Rhizophagus irregularis]